MGTKTFNNYEDLLTFTRASKGHALRPVSYGDELITNTWVDNSAGSSSISESNGELTLTCVGSGVAWAYEQIDLKAGSLYVVSYEVKQDVGGNVHIYIGETTAGSQSYSKLASVGSYTDSFIASANTSYISLREFTAGTAIVDNISVKEVLFDQPDGTLTLFEHPNNIPRVEWDADRNRLGLLVEEARTNLITYSTPNSNWSTSALGTGVAPVVTLNNESAPDGTLSAAKLVLDTGAGTTSSDRSIYLAPSANVTATNSYSGSVWLKGEVGGEQIVMRHAGNATYSLFTLTTSWARYEVTETASSSLATMAIGLKGNQSDLTATIYVWGAQVEAGSFPTSYIKSNSGSTVTRAADKATLDLADFGYNHKTGTVLVEFDAKYESGGSGFPRVYEISTGTDPGNRILSSFNEAGNTLSSAVAIGGTGQASLTLKTGLSGSTSGKIAFAFAKDDFASSDDGDTVVTDTSGTFEPDDKRTLLAFGASVSGLSNNITGHIKSFKYYPRRLTNAQLQEITS